MVEIMAERDEKRIRVVDRRMFTPEGELRPEFEAEERVSPPEPAPRPTETPRTEIPPPRPEKPRTNAADTASGEEPRSDFATMVRSLATTAYSALGLLPDPAGGRHRDPMMARQMIDWLGVLEQKTRGNLSFEESDFLSRALYELRLAYVEVTRPAGR
jgi:hypothetical protein